MCVAHLSCSVVEGSGENVQEDGAVTFDTVFVHVLDCYTEHAQ